MVPEILRVCFLLLKETLTSCKSFSDIIVGWGQHVTVTSAGFSPILGCVELSPPSASLAHFPKKT